MILTINTASNVALCLLDPTSGLAYNRTADAMEPFDASKHLTLAKPSPVVPATPAAGTATPATPAATFATIRYVDAGSALANRTNLSPTWLAVDANGVPTGTVVDVWPNPYAVAPNGGGWSGR